MKRKKHLLLMGALLTLCLTSILSAFAHPGRTDSNGGHWDRSNGTYHFHTGEYAGKEQYPGSKSSDSFSFKKPYRPPTANPYKNKDEDVSHDNPNYIALFSILSVIGIPIILSLFYFLYCWFFLFPKELLDNYAKSVNKLKKQIEINSELAIRPDDYELTLIPEGITINEADNLPQENGCSADTWGKSFTAYISNRGKKIHTKRGCCNAYHSVHLYHYKNSSELLCNRCSNSFSIPSFDWYEKYIRVSYLRKNAADDKQLNEIRKSVQLNRKKCNNIIFKIFLLFSPNNRRKLKNLDKSIMPSSINSKQKR